ncbi:MAG TPA: glycosyltransferase family 1 protein [Bryobacteraceae bacterium]|nr:glycosyltransferase family 1 protein [Bryobacteraceae bacterium]
MKRLRITIDATSTLVRSAGIKNYTYHWISHLRRKAAGAEEIRAFPFLGGFGELDHERSARPRWSTFARLAALHAINRIGPPALDWAIRGTDIFHGSNQVYHAPRRARLTATIHDLTALTMPEVHTPGNVYADRNFAREILQRANALIAVSENTRQDAIRLLRISPDRITTIYSGVPQKYFEARPLRRKRPYALYVGTIEPRKNLSALLDAWRQLKPCLRQEFELAIAGPEGWASEATMSRIRTEAVYLGYVPEADLPGLIAGAAAFVYPSLYEGFGFPVVQAMAAGTPVVTSNTSCLPEVAGDAALLADPRSPAEIASALTRVLESEDLRAELGSRGRHRAQLYRWETCAEQSLRFFRNLA